MRYWEADQHAQNELGQGTFEAWACSECGWIFSNPRLHVTDKGASDKQVRDELFEGAKAEFEAHACDKSPKKPTRE